MFGSQCLDTRRSVSKRSILAFGSSLRILSSFSIGVLKLKPAFLAWAGTQKKEKRRKTVIHLKRFKIILYNLCVFEIGSIISELIHASRQEIR